MKLGTVSFIAILCLIGAVDCALSLHSSCNSLDRLLASPQHKIKLWNLARLQIGLSPLGINDDLMLFIDDFLHFSPGISLFHINNSAVAYVRIYKCANSNIDKNLFSASTKFPENLMYGFVAMDADNLLKFASGFSPPKAVRSFTFVREPLSHFQSGFREYLQRCPGHFHDSASKVIGASFIANEIARILNGLYPKVTCRLSGAFRHLYAMSGALRPYWNLSFVGHLEYFDEDWSQIERIYGINVPDNYNVGQHRSSKDEHGVEAAFAELHLSSPSYFRALCVILIFDYHCFNLALPSVCRGLSHAVEKEVWGI